MNYTKAIEERGTKWLLSEFIALHGKLSIIQEYETGLLCGRFNNKGMWIHVHIDKSVRNTSVSSILSKQSDYEVVVLDVEEEYCLCKRNCSIDYNTIYRDLYFYETEPVYFNVQDYYNENSDIFDGEVL